MTQSWASSGAIRRTMQSNRRRDTGPELRLRSLLHGMGLRYRVDARPIPRLNRRADIVFRSAKVAVFVHGCFWHGCQLHYSPPTANSSFWSDKLKGNLARDRQTLAALAEEGWETVVVWEHDDPSVAAHAIADLVESRRGQRC